MAKKDKDSLVVKASSREELIRKMESKYKHPVSKRIKETKAYSSGILELDIASGIGGHKCGGIIEIFGAESSGKSLIALKAIATAQRKYNKPCVLFDLEFATPEQWMLMHGVNPEECETPPVQDGEEMFDMALDFVRSGLYAYIVVDSLVGAIPRAILDGSVASHDVGVDARMIAKGLRKLQEALSSVDTNLIIVNQIRAKINQSGFGNPETTPGGYALKFYSAQRLKVSKKMGSDFKRNNQVAGHTVVTNYVKNKSAPPKRKAEFRIDFERGVNNMSALLTHGLEFEVIQQDGNMLEYSGIKVNGSKQFEAELQNDPVAADALWDDILKKMKEDIPTVSAAVPDNSDDDEEEVGDGIES